LRVNESIARDLPDTQNRSSDQAFRARARSGVRAGI
jgi:hypothetical protein